MNGLELYVNEVLTRIERERRQARRSNRRWLLEIEVTPPPRRSFTAWLGDRLVGLGERLRGWSASEQQSTQSRRAL